MERCIIERPHMSKKFITEQDVLAAAKRGEKSISVDDDTRLTPSAVDAARQHTIELTMRVASPLLDYQSAGDVKLYKPEKTNNTKAGTTVVLGADHGGFELKEKLRQHLLSLGYTVADVGTYSDQTCDYPDFAYAVASYVASGRAGKGIMIDGVGAASAMVANKVPGVRAVPAYSEFVARSSREHNDANVLTLGWRVTGIESAKSIVDVWLSTWFGGGRHQSRVNKIAEIERRFAKDPHAK
jgi:ribose 5-phosphate isomerase B